MWLDFFLCFFLGPLGVHKFKERKIDMGILYLFTFGLFGIGWIFDTIRYLLAAIKGEKLETRSSSSESLNVLLPDATLPIVVATSLILQTDEKCHYSRSATKVVTKNKVVGYTGGSSGLSIRIAKGMNYRIGASKRAPIRRNVQETYPGTLSITNKRIIFTASKGSFDKKISILSAIVPYKNGFDLQFGSQTYSLETNDTGRIFQIISHIINET